MTISTITNKTTGTQGTGAAQTIAFTFPVFASGEVKVRARNTTTGDETLLTVTTHYTVSLTGTGTPNYTGGSITTTATCYGTYDTGYYFYVYRITTQTQATDLAENDTLPAETIEARFDKLFCLIADLQEQVNRCLKFPLTDSTALTSQIDDSVTRVSKYLKFDSSGNVTVSAT